MFKKLLCIGCLLCLTACTATETTDVTTPIEIEFTNMDPVSFYGNITDEPFVVVTEDEFVFILLSETTTDDSIEYALQCINLSDFNLNYKIENLMINGYELSNDNAGTIEPNETINDSLLFETTELTTMGITQATEIKFDLVFDDTLNGHIYEVTIYP